MLREKSVTLGALALLVVASGCASIERCEETGGTVVDVTALAMSSNGSLVAGGTLYRLKHCVLEEVAGKGPRKPEGLLVSVSKNRGKSWAARRILVDEAYQGYELAALAAGHDGRILAGVNQWSVSFLERGDTHARLLASSDDGRHWKEVHDFGTDSIVSVVLAADAVVVALCREGVMRSADAGKTWANTGLRAALSCSNLRLISNRAGDMYAGAWGRNGPGFYRSSDAGASWTRMPIPAPGYRGMIAANDKGDVIAANSGPWELQLYRSTDHGRTWVPLKPPHASWEEQLGVSADGSLLLKTMDNIFAPGGGSFISTDGGAHWSRTGNIPGQDSLLVDPAGGLYAYERINFYVPPSTWGWGGQIHSSDDLGQTWHAHGPLVDDPQP